MSSELSINQHVLTRIALQALTHGTTHAGARNLYDVLGYAPRHTTESFVARYSRGDIAHRIISAYPDATWGKAPEIVENDESEDKTPFELEVSKLVKSTRLWQYINRADKLSGLGEYSILLLGFQDGKPLSQPVQKAKGISYLMPFADISAKIQTFDLDEKSERFGLPLTYAVTTGGYQAQNSTAMSSKSITVHWSRVLHLADGCLDNDVLGLPRLRPIINRLQDLDKVLGGSAETFWTNARGGLALNAAAGAEVPDVTKLKENVSDYINNLQRMLLTQGMEVKPLELTVADPSSHVSVLLDVIAGTTGIPKRILIGSERGELASSQDETNWSNRVKERQINYAQPFIVEPLIERFMAVGVLPRVDEFQVKWSELSSISESDKSTIAVNRANAISTYVNSSGGDLIVPPKQFVVDVLGLDYREDDINAALNDERDEMEKDAAEQDLDF